MIEQIIPVSVESMDARTWRRFRGWCVEENLQTGKALQFILERFLDDARGGRIPESEIDRAS